MDVQDVGREDRGTLREGSEMKEAPEKQKDESPTSRQGSFVEVHPPALLRTMGKSYRRGLFFFFSSHYSRAG